jgi:hypothetical protein
MKTISGSVPEEYRAIGAAWQTAANGASEKLKDHVVVFLSAEDGGWIDTGISVVEGQEITLLSHGQVWLSREADLAFGSNVTLWYRIDNGVIARSPASSVTFKAKDSGKLHLITKPPGEWANRHGDFLPDYPHAGATGGVLVATLVWSGSANEGLEAFVVNDQTGTASTEVERRANEKPLPKGWVPLWRVGETSMFSEETDGHGRSVLACRCNNDAAILTYPVDVALDDTVRLDWSWCITKLPSRLAEDELATHDYLSVAVEFDNGQDVSYIWSASLPVDTAFRCPIPFWWDKHETHIVCHSGNKELGCWVDGSRPILEDYRYAVDAIHLPTRIVAVWVLGITPFQRSVGECEFRGLQLNSSTDSVWIGP